ncbi:NAD(P)-dependent alcohol dehydrogenase [Actinoplanes sp. DH11]|uniref:NAD(P)-dependent alcohol dehydrogenase n=1 Tax=Actinoplanes sp. DH11 TaxID=2857011 RepID=UPI001E5EB8A1|nr:NAD(P)-dependent alcohol dehydrogenase [Actinoplanes sp. DH11]
MKAIVQNRYGGPDVLSYDDVPRPAVDGDRVLVRVRAAALNAWDWHVVRGDPAVSRLAFGLTRPRNRVRGRDLAGVVEEVGPAVTRFRPGDEVFGDAGAAEGAFAEYAAVAENLLAVKPPDVTFEQAAAVPLAGLTALRGVRDVGRAGPGRRILINGASGGVGTFAVQLAGRLGAEVTAVCSGRNADLVRSLGADHVIDYTRADFTAGGQRYDVVLDLVGNRSLGECRGVLNPGGTLILSGGGVYEGGSLLGPMGLVIRGRVASRLARDRRVVVLETAPDRAVLDVLAGMVSAGTLTPAIARTWPLAATADAIRHLETGHASGKLVVTV